MQIDILLLFWYSFIWVFCYYSTYHDLQENYVYKGNSE